MTATAFSFKLLTILILFFSFPLSLLSNSEIFNMPEKEPEKFSDYGWVTGFQNSAALHFLNISYINLSCKNDFLLKEMMTKEFKTVLKYKSNRFILSLNHFGYSNFGNLKVSAGYTKGFGSKFSCGMQFHYLLDHARNYNAIHSFTFDLSFQCLITQKNGFGLFVYNPARLKSGITGEQIIPIHFEYNYFYKIKNNLSLFCIVEKSLPGAFDTQLGMMFHKKQFQILSTVSFSHFSIQIALFLKSFLFEIRSDCYYKTGLSPSLKLYYLF